MKVLLAFLVTFSVFAADQFATDKETTLKRLHASNAAPTVVTCVEKAKTMEEMTACEKAPTAPVETHAKAVGHKPAKAKHI